MKCAICGVAEATHGNYCKTCLDRETWTWTGTTSKQVLRSTFVKC